MIMMMIVGVKHEGKVGQMRKQKRQRRTEIRVFNLIRVLKWLTICHDVE